MKINEHDCVVLTADLPDDNLKAGDVGTVIHIHKGGAAYEVEFTTLDGRTLTVATVERRSSARSPAAMSPMCASCRQLDRLPRKLRVAG